MHSPSLVQTLQNYDRSLSSKLSSPPLSHVPLRIIKALLPIKISVVSILQSWKCLPSLNKSSFHGLQEGRRITATAALLVNQIYMSLAGTSFSSLSHQNLSQRLSQPRHCSVSSMKPNLICPPPQTLLALNSSGSHSWNLLLGPWISSMLRVILQGHMPSHAITKTTPCVAFPVLYFAYLLITRQSGVL